MRTVEALLIVVAGVLTALNLGARTSAHWQIPVAVLLICLVLLVDPAAIDAR